MWKVIIGSVSKFFTKIHLYITLSAAFYGLFMTGLYLHTRTDVKELEGQLQEAKGAIISLEEENSRCRESKEADMALLAHLCIKLEGHTERSNDLLMQIDQLAYKAPQNASQEGRGTFKDVPPEQEADIQNETVDINGKLPPALIGVLQEAFSGDKDSL